MLWKVLKPAESPEPFDVLWFVACMWWSFMACMCESSLTHNTTPPRASSTLSMLNMCMFFTYRSVCVSVCVLVYGKRRGVKPQAFSQQKFETKGVVRILKSLCCNVEPALSEPRCFILMPCFPAFDIFRRLKQIQNRQNKYRTPQ